MASAANISLDGKYADILPFFQLHWLVYKFHEHFWHFIVGIVFVCNYYSDTQGDDAVFAIQSYLSLFEHQSYDFQYHFTENCALDWYGKLMRGAHRVHEYLR